MLISVSAPAQTGAEPSNQIETASMPQLAAERRSDRARCGPDCRRVSASITTIRSLDQETAGKRQSVIHGLQRELAELPAEIATLKARPQMNYRGAESRARSMQLAASAHGMTRHGARWSARTLSPALVAAARPVGNLPSNAAQTANFSGHLPSLQGAEGLREKVCPYADQVRCTDGMCHVQRRLRKLLGQ
jgi:hypothetical protein